ncbi:MAG TPA: YsnF/AvaK domain-containing protein [Caldimonas sp.]|jgi:uncharacterized protein (TIGR02271 family)|nr:YsnF/AvaK domain-containing protein [Caldimonas sp.]HEX2540860.1 YsnF/AvaK domain-containing protein [Caldimonas sp.]
MSQEDAEAGERLPLMEEVLSVGKRSVETGRVRVSTKVEERLAEVAQDLVRENVEVEYVDIGREIEVAPEVRIEGETIVIPLIEEVLVVEKRLILRQELRVRRRTHSERVEEAVPLRRTTAVVERLDGDEQDNTSGGT